MRPALVLFAFALPSLVSARFRLRRRATGGGGYQCQAKFSSGPTPTNGQPVAGSPTRSSSPTRTPGSSPSPSAGGNGNPNSGGNDTPNGGRSFNIVDKWQGQTFWDGWDFWNFPDPTHGNVEYVSGSEAFSSGLAAIEGGQAVLKVDDTNRVPVGGNRKSVRLQSKKSYDNGLFVLDVQEMPYGCGVWPAFWSNGPDWPHGGEIDILEGVHDGPTNHYTLHTSEGCTIDTSRSDEFSKEPGSSGTYFSGDVVRTDCNAFINSNSGCGIGDPDTRSYGRNLNSNGGGVFATLLDDEGIKIWFFSRNDIPSDMETNPTPQRWGQPKAFFSTSTCSTRSFFKSQTIIINTTLCGDWAGSSYSAAGCPGTCAERVADPANFSTAKWKINYVAIFQ